MGLIYSDFAEDGMVCSATRVVLYLVAAGAPGRLVGVIEHDMVVLKCIYCRTGMLWITTVVGGVSADATPPVMTNLWHLISTITISSDKTRATLAHLISWVT